MNVRTFTLIVFLPLTLSAQVRTTFTGTNSDSTVKYVRIIKYSPLYRDFDKPLNILTEDREGPSFLLNLDVSKPEPLSLQFLNGGPGIVFVTPGDKIRFSISRQNNKPVIVFAGKNSAHYAYDALSDIFIRQSNMLPRYDKTKEISAYKELLSKWRDLKIKFLSEYRANNEVSTAFLEYAENDIDYGYVHLLCNPLRNIEKKMVPGDYFDLADSLFKKHDYKLKYKTSNSLLAFTYRFIMYGEENYLENFDAISNRIKRQLSGVTRDYLLANMIGVYANQRSDGYRPALLKFINSAPALIRDTSILSYIGRREIEYTKLNRPFPDEILKTTYLKKLNSNKIISLGELINSYKEEGLYIDLWASWCGPCRHDIADSGPSKEFLKKITIRPIYISMDTKANESKWIKAAIDDKITEDQYILIDDFKSPLTKFLNSYSIPRYVMLDKLHHIKAFDAPRLNSVQLPALKNAVMNMSAITYQP